MAIESVNPASGEKVRSYAVMSAFTKRKVSRESSARDLVRVHVYAQPSGFFETGQFSRINGFNIDDL